jgi:hypothetical protein
MDISKLLSDIPTYLSNYVNTSILVLSNPKKIYSISETDENLITDKTKYNLPANVYSYCLLSIFIGVTIQQLIGFKYRQASDIKDSAISILYILFVWILFISLSFLVCWILKGKSNYKTHLSVSLLIFSMSYLLSNIIAFLVYAIFKSLGKLDQLPSQLEQDKAIIYVPIHFLFLTFFLSIALIPLHQLTKIKGAIFILITICLLIILSLFTFLVSPYLEGGFG